MASSTTSAPGPLNAQPMQTAHPAPPHTRALQRENAVVFPCSSAPHTRPLQRENAVVFPSSEEQALLDAMSRSSPMPDEPEALLGKRTRTDNGNLDSDSEGGDAEPQDGTPATSVPHHSNVVAAAVRYASHKRLRPEQRGELDSFLLESTALGRQAKIFVALLSIENKVDSFKSAAPPYQVSEELKTNINNYALAVLLSIEISAYKGDIPRNHILNILKRFCFDLPVGIEHDLSNWEKITTAVSYSLTQTRAKIKKLIRDSITEDCNIFALSQLIIHGTPCRVTVQLCARVALMRAVHRECSGSEKFWNLIDSRLTFIRNSAAMDKSKINRAFKAILQADRSKYGAGDDYQIGDSISNEWQQRVDNVVSGISDHQLSASDT